MHWQPGSHGAEDFRIEAGERPITGALWLPPAHAAATPVVLCGHGASGDRYQAPIPYLAWRFVTECGFAVLSIDGPVHGLRQQGAGGRAAFFEEMRRPGFIDRMVDDWRVAWREAADARDLDGGAAGYFGLSMGTIFGVPLLASGLAFAASVIGLCGVSGAGRDIAQRLRGDARTVRHPVLFLMQLEDELFDRAGCLELFDALGSDDKRLHANPGRHPEVPAEEIDFAFGFLAARLQGAVPRRIVNPLAE